MSALFDFEIYRSASFYKYLVSFQSIQELTYLPVQMEVSSDNPTKNQSSLNLQILSINKLIQE
jgi:hypothetical protein